MTDDELAKTLGEARARATELHAMTDIFNERIVALEQTFKSLNLGVEAEVPLDDESKKLLAFAKDRGEFRLLVVDKAAVSVQDILAKRTPLIHASRSVRVKAVELLPVLLLAMIQEVDRQIESVSGAIEKADEVNDELALILATARAKGTE